MSLGHKVLSVEVLASDVRRLYGDYIVGSNDTSVDSLINELKGIKENMITNWKGPDAAIHINFVIDTINGLITLRNTLVKLVEGASAAASQYRMIQISNGVNSLGELSIIRTPDMGRESSFNSNPGDEIGIAPDIVPTRTRLVNVMEKLNTFISEVRNVHSQIAENWVVGDGRDNLMNAFAEFSSKYDSVYRPNLEKVVSNIDTALKNYLM